MVCGVFYISLKTQMENMKCVIKTLESAKIHKNAQLLGLDFLSYRHIQSKKIWVTKARSKQSEACWSRPPSVGCGHDARDYT